MSLNGTNMILEGEPINVQYVLSVDRIIQTEEDMALVKTVRGGLEFLDANHTCDRWFLQIECFDPHEPFLRGKRLRKSLPG